MAGVLKSPTGSAQAFTGAPRGWWAVDKLIAGYLAATAILIAAYLPQVPDAGLLLGLHAASVLLIAASAKEFSQPSKFQAVFRHWYPLVYVGLCYKEMSVLIPAIRKTDLDAKVAQLDYRIWGAYPTVWLERLHNPWLTEFLQLAYTLFVPCVLLVAAVLWLQRRYPEFRCYAFIVSLGFLASYVGYFLVPVRGPRFFLAHLQHFKLYGVWLFGPMQRALDHLESAHYDCFPSGHTELTLIACWSSRRISMKLFGAYCVYSLLIVLATVYLRYHYTVDVLAGVILAATVLAAAPGICVSAKAASELGSGPAVSGLDVLPKKEEN
jgi:membrane-associated phospholipid phosphatase